MAKETSQNGPEHQESSNPLPEKIEISAEKAFDLRYGENPHQHAAVYFEADSTSALKNLVRVSGRELSLVNLTDINAGIESVRLFDTPTTAIIKHNTPCGIASGDSTAQSLALAIESDPESAFGGVVVSNRPIDIEAAKVIAAFKQERKSNMDIVAAPAIDDDAAQLLRTTRKTVVIYTFGAIPQHAGRRNIKWIDGGLIVQDADDDIENGFDSWEVVTKVHPTPEQLRQMRIAWKFITRIKSNAVIVVDRDLPMTRGIGTGQTSRVRSTKLALELAGDHTTGAILASDSFFPFDDSVMLAAKHGIPAIIQQGDSIRDKEIVEA